MHLIFLILTLVTLGNTSEEQSSPIVNLPLGKIQGTYQSSLNNKKFFSFEGVPYAQPPIGEHKFKESIPPKPWSGVLQAKTLYQCLQLNHFLLLEEDSECVEGDEDCLYLNIYTPTLDQNAELDVVVHIHGGAFMFNHGGYQRPDYIMDRNLVYVSLNYRLGPFGFLSTEDDALPGNIGLKDQTLALKWIQQNIRFFGGNPASVTIIGLSAGGASVHLHLLSPRSKGLFHRAISQSGCAINPWVLTEKSLQKTKQMATLLGCPTDNTHQMADCLTQRPGKQIVNTIRHFLPWLYNPFTPFGVVVDSKSPNPFLPEHPYEMMKAGKSGSDVPWIISMTNSEGLYPGAEFYSDSRLNEINKKWASLAPFILDYNNTVEDENKLNKISQKIRKQYLGDADISKSTYRTLIDLISERLFEHDIEKTAKIYQKNGYKSPVYYYYFKFRGTHSISSAKMGVNEDFGASHGDDACYILNLHVNMAEKEKDKQMMAVMLDMVASFAKTGVPKVPISWPVINQHGSLPRLLIASPTNISISFESTKNSEFWKSLPIMENEKLLINDKDEL